MASRSTSHSRGRLLPASLAVLLTLGLVVPAVPLASAVTLADNTPYLDSLDGASPRDDHDFTAATGTWSVVGTLLYAQSGNTGDFRAELRKSSLSGAVLAWDPVGNFYTRNSLSILAIDGWNLGAPDTFYVSEILNNVAPSYAVEFEGAPVSILAPTFSDSATIGSDGVLNSYQVFLSRRDTIDVSLSVPANYTYNYNLQLYLFGAGGSLYYSNSGSGSPGPAAVSAGPQNARQFVRFTAPSDGWYLLVVGNTFELADVPYTLQVATNGEPLGDRAPVRGTVDNYNRNDDYRFQNAGSDWALAAVRTDNPGYGEWLTAELHAPTLDSNVLTAESPTSGSMRVGVLAVNTFPPDDLNTTNPSLVTVRWGPNALYPVDYTLELDNRLTQLSENESKQRLAFNPGEILRGVILPLAAGETLEFHAEVDQLFTYPYELQLIAFAPGHSYYSAGGPAQAGPIASAREGPSLPKDLTFTAPASGYYGIAILSLLSSNAVPVDVTVTIQGRTLSPSVARTGTLSDANPQDQFAFTISPSRWGVVTGRNTGGSGAYEQRLHANGLDTNPVAADTLGTTPNALPFALEAVNGYLISSARDFYVSVVRTAGSPDYFVEYDTAPVTLPALNATYPASVPANQIVEGFEIFLNARDRADFRLRVPSGYTYPYAMQLAAFAPADAYYSTSGRLAPAPLATSDGAANTEQNLVITAPVPGYYLLVIANRGNLTGLPFELSVTVNGEPVSPGTVARGDLNAANRVDYYSFAAPAGSWTLVGVKIDSTSDPSDWLVHSLHGPTPDSLPVATDRLRGTGGEGIVAVNGYQLATNTDYYLSEAASLAPGRAVTYTLQVTSAFQTLGAASQVVSGTLPAYSQFAGYTINLAAGQTLDLRLERAEGYSYPFDLGLFVFPPAAGNASSSGEAGGAPIAASMNGASNEQDGIFTAPASGPYLLVVANLDVPREVNYTLNLTLDGWEIPVDSHLRGTLNRFNRQDQYRFQTSGAQWNVAGLKWTAGEGTASGALHTLGLNTLPLASVDASGTNSVAVLPFFAGVGNATSTFFLNVTRPLQSANAGDTAYAVDFDGAPALWANSDLGLTQPFILSGGGFLSLHALDLKQGDWVEIRMYVDPTYGKTYDLNLALYGAPTPPQILTTVPLATSRNGPNVGESMSFFANEAGQYLLVVENAENLDTVPYLLSITRHTVLGTPPRAVTVSVTDVGKDFIVVAWTPSDESDFLAYDLFLSTDPAQFPPKFQVDHITNRTATAYRIESLQPGQSYTIRVLVTDRENLATWSDPITTVTVAKTFFDDPVNWALLAVAVVGGLTVFLVYFARRQPAEGRRPWRLRSSRAEGVVTEGKGPKGAPRPPKSAEVAPSTPPGVPPPPTKSTQEAVDYMHRIQKGGR